MDKDTLRSLAPLLSEAQAQEYSTKNKPYSQSLTTLRALPLLTRAQTLARIHAALPLFHKRKIAFHLEGCSHQEQQWVLQALKAQTSP
jgi:hypothetical protein